jgi:hypothetical protein
VFVVLIWKTAISVHITRACDTNKIKQNTMQEKEIRQGRSDRNKLIGVQPQTTLTAEECFFVGQIQLTP